MLSGGDDASVKLWDAATGRLVRTFLGHAGSVEAVALAPDGRRVVSGDSLGGLKLWDAATGRLIHTFEGHTGFINSVSFSPDGRYVLSGSADRTARLWDAAKGGLIQTFRHATTPAETSDGVPHIDVTLGVTSVAFSPTARGWRRVATATSGSRCGMRGAGACCRLSVALNGTNLPSRPETPLVSGSRFRRMAPACWWAPLHHWRCGMWQRGS